MAVERFTRNPDSRRARAVTRVTIGSGEGFGQDEIAALDEIAGNLAGPLLQRQTRSLKEFMESRGWPTTLGWYWANDDGSRWQLAESRAEAKPGWATLSVVHPAALYEPRSAERDAFDMLALSEQLDRLLDSGAPGEKLVEIAILFGMLVGRNNFERQFGRATDIGIGRILGGRKGGKAYGALKEPDRERRLGALRRAIDEAPDAGPSAWARAVKRFWPNSDDPEGAALKFYNRNRDLLGHEILMS